MQLVTRERICTELPPKEAQEATTITSMAVRVVSISSTRLMSSVHTATTIVRVASTKARPSRALMTGRSHRRTMVSITSSMRTSGPSGNSNQAVMSGTKGQGRILITISEVTFSAQEARSSIRSRVVKRPMEMCMGQAR